MGLPFDAARAKHAQVGSEALQQQSPVRLGQTTRRNAHLQRKGIDLVLSAIQDTEAQKNNAYGSLRSLLTLSNRVPVSMAMESLTPFEQRVVEQTQAQPELPLSPYGETIPENSVLVIQERKVGHVSILLPDEVADYPLAEQHFVAGTIQFSPSEYTSLVEYKKRSEAEFQERSAEVTSALTRLEQDGQLTNVLENVRDNIMRIGPTFVHVNQQIYSTFDQAGKNVVDRKVEGGNRLLSVLPQTPVSEWRIEDQVYVYGLHLLFMSGGPSRIEEFNGGQLTPATLNNFFDRKALTYANTLGEELPPEYSSYSLAQKAQYIGKQLPKVNEGFQRYREINGLMVRQEEHILGRKEYVPDTAIQGALTRSAGRVFNFPRLEEELPEQYWQRLTNAAISRETTKADGEISPVSLLLYTILNEAVEATNSDIAMSSSFRNAQQVIEDGSVALDKQDFYCAVVPSQRMIEAHEDSQTARVLELIAKRMEFNRWHFFPNDVDRSQIPDGREWFYPPTIPDIATEVDHHHAGHIDTLIHHSLRYPSPITVNGREIKGAYDIRLMRQDGEPYLPKDITVAKEYLTVLGSILNTVVASAEQGKPVNIDAFTVSWYRNNTWKEYKQIVNS